MDGDTTDKDKFYFLALGDSYTIGEAVKKEESFPLQLSTKLNSVFQNKINTQIIATTGWRTDELVTAVEKEKLNNTYDFVTLLIGVNNQFQKRDFLQYKEEFVQLLDIAVALARGKTEKVVVLSIPDYAFTPFGKNKEGVSQGVDKYNVYAKSISISKKVDFINITDISRRGLEEPELVASDGLHISGLVYKEVVERIFDMKFKDLKTLK